MTNPESSLFPFLKNFLTTFELLDLSLSLFILVFSLIVLYNNKIYCLSSIFLISFINSSLAQTLNAEEFLYHILGFLPFYICSLSPPLFLCNFNQPHDKIPSLQIPIRSLNPSLKSKFIYSTNHLTFPLNHHKYNLF